MKVGALRAEVKKRVAASGAGVVAQAIGIAPATLRGFLGAQNTHRGTVAQIERWVLATGAAGAGRPAGPAGAA